MDEKLSEAVHFRLSSADYKQLAKVAEKESRTVSQQVRKWVLAALYFAVSGKKKS